MSGNGTNWTLTGLTLKVCKGARSRNLTLAVRLAIDADRIVSRLAPPRKDAPVTFSLPEMQAASDALTAVNQIGQAVAKGEITPGEATSLASLVETFRKTAETDDLAKRIERLEQRK